MQRLGDEDLCGFLLNPREVSDESIKAWKHIKLVALNKEKEIYALDNFTYEREANEPLFTKKHDIEALHSLRLQLGEDEFETQYQQVPKQVKQGIFKAYILIRFQLMK